MVKKAKRKVPWKRANPRKRTSKAVKHLSVREKSAAKALAKRAGRLYPNLVDNMRMAKAAKNKGVKKSNKADRRTIKKAAKKKTTRKQSKDKQKDPEGGLTAAGRKAFAKKDGSHLRPGVTKKLAEMTPTEMRRKGSWAVRFYGRAKQPPLVDAQGQPTRHALTAHAWGEPVPKTPAAARQIAARGKRLLKRYHKMKSE
jgi:Domain of unknown function (DUF6321)